MSKTLLILAGDTFEIRSLFVSLEVERYSVERCATSDAIWQRLQDSENPPLALLVSLGAPWDSMKGVLRRFRASENGLKAPILILGSPEEAPADKDMLGKAGVNPEDFFPAPFDGAMLVERLKSIPEEGEPPPEGFEAAVAKSIRGVDVSSGEIPIASAVELEPENKEETSFPASGSLDRMTPAKIISTLVGQKATGRLDIHLPEGKGAVYFKDGKLMFLAASDQMGLAAYLVRAGQLTPEQLEGNRDDVTVSWLIGKGLVSPHQAFTVLNNHLRYWLRTVASQRKGQFMWLERIGVPPGSFPLDVPLHRTLLDGILQNPPVSHPLPIKLAQAVPELTESGRDVLEALALGGGEARLARAIDGRTRLFMLVQGVAKEDSNRQAQLEALLIGLRELGVVSFKAVRGVASQPMVVPVPVAGASSEEQAWAPLEELRLEWERIREADAFDIMNVKPDTDPEIFRKRFFDMSKRYHPDKYFEAEEESQQLAGDIFKAVREAYASISDPQQREALQKMRLAGTEVPITEDDEGRAAIAARQGGLFLRNRNYQQSQYFYDKAVELNPLVLEYHFMSTWTFFLANPKEVELSLARLHALLKKEPKYTQGFYYLGCMLKAVPDMEQAKRSFNKVLALQPNHIEAQRELRLIDMRHRKSKEAKKKSKGRGLFGFRRS